MGERGQIAIKNPNDQRVYLYTHWYGPEIPEVLKAALKRGRNRWDDESYLARIIFNEMTKGKEMEDTGYGIDTYKHIDTSYPIPVLDCNTQTITWEKGAYGDQPPEPISFADFVGTD